MCLKDTLFVTASLLLTFTFIAVGISFFGPFWLSNLPSAVNETQYADPKGESYLPNNTWVWQYPDRGLWAQCGRDCVWFWTNDSRIQKHLFNPLSKYPILYSRNPVRAPRGLIRPRRRCKLGAI